MHDVNQNNLLHVKMLCYIVIFVINLLTYYHINFYKYLLTVIVILIRKKLISDFVLVVSIINKTMVNLFWSCLESALKGVIYTLSWAWIPVGLGFKLPWAEVDAKASRCF